jgi:WD40 repeat protein
MEGREIVVVTAAQGSGGRDGPGGKGGYAGAKGGGITFINLSTGALYSQSMKNCICPTQGISPSSHLLSCNCVFSGITTSGGISSFSGRGGCGDFIIAAQSKKPQINIWQWGKPHALMQCHIQEITTAIATDLNGFFLSGGTKGGRIFVWELSSGALVQSWQAHFKALTTMTFTPCGNFLISASEDGMVRAWDLVSLLNSEGRGGHSDFQIKSFSPYR